MGVASTPRLAARDIQFTYPSATAFRIEGWSAQFPAGRVTALTGPSGCGKSTRLFLLGLMVRAGGGVVEIDGERVDALPDAERSALRADRYGFVFQDAVLDTGRSVLDNILEPALYRRELREPLVDRALALMDAFEVSVPATRRPGEISGGQAQRIALCRALVGEPDIVLADEPTGNLDRETSRSVLGGLRGRADAGACVVVVTHDPLVADQCDAVIDLGSP